MGYHLGQHAVLKIDRAPSIEQLQQALSQALSSATDLDLYYDGSAWCHAQECCPCQLIESDCDQITQVPLPTIDHHRHTLCLSVIHLKRPDHWYLCFTLFHGAGDGVSLVNFLYLFFAALGQRPLEACHFDTQEHDFTKKLKKKRTTVPLHPTCQPVMDAPAVPVQYLIRTEEAPYLPTAALCRLAASCFAHGRAIMLVPIDLRRFCPAQEGYIMGNLALPLFFDAAAKDVSQIWQDIHAFVTENRVPVFGKFPSQVYRAIPGCLRRGLLGCYIRHIRRCGKVPVAALVSNIGKIQAAQLQNSCFRVEDCHIAFENLPIFALTLITLSLDGHTNTCISTYNSPLSPHAAQSLTQRIQQILDDPVMH